MDDNTAMLPDPELDDLLAALSDSLTIPRMADNVSLARQRIESRATVEQLFDRVSGPTPDRDDRAVAFQPKEILQLPLDEQRSKIREFGLLGVGLAAAALLAFGLTFVFRGFDNNADRIVDYEPAGRFTDYPIAPETYDIPGFEFVDAIGQPRVPNEPVDVAIGPDGSRYVLDVAIDRVIAFNANWEVESNWGNKGFSERIVSSTSLAAGPDGSVYVAAGNTLYTIDASGTISDRVELSEMPEVPGGQTPNPTIQDIAVDSQGRLFAVRSPYIWVRNDGEDDFSRVTVDAQSILQIAVGAQDQIFVSTIASDFRVLDPSLDGTSTQIRPSRGLPQIHGFTIGPEGNIVVFLGQTARTPSSVVILDPNGQEVGRWTTDVLPAFGISEPVMTGIAVDADGAIVLPDPQFNRLMVLSKEGDIFAEITDGGSGTLGRLWRIGLDNDSNVFVLDPSIDGQVIRFDPSGELTQTIDLGRREPRVSNSVIYSSGMAVLPDGRVVIADHSLNQVLVFSENGEREQQWGEFDLEGGAGLAFPKTAATDPDGSIYLVDETGEGNLRAFSTGGEFLGSIGTVRGDRVDITYYGDAIWAADGESILRYPLDGGEPTTIATTALGEAGGVLPGLPYTLALDANGNIYTYLISIRGDSGDFTGMLAMLDPSGNLLWSTELADARDRYIDLAVGQDGGLYLGDSEQRQVLVYRPADDPREPVPTTEESGRRDPLILERTALEGMSAQITLYDPVTLQQRSLPRGEIVGISPDGEKLLLIDQETEDDRLRLDLIAVSVDTNEEVWRTDIGQRADSGRATIYFDTVVTTDVVYVAFHDPEYRTNMLEIAAVRITDGYMQQFGALGLDTNVILGEPGTSVDLLSAGAPSTRTVLISNTTSGEIVGLGREVFTNFADFSLPDGTPHMLPNDQGLFFLPPNGFHIRPAIFYLPFGRGGGADVVLPFKTTGSNEAVFVIYLLAADGRTLFALSPDAGQVAIVDLMNLDAPEIVDLDGLPGQVMTSTLEGSSLGALYTHKAAVSSPDGRYLYSLGSPGNQAASGIFTPIIWKIDTTTWEVVHAWIPEAPWVADGLSINSAGTNLYVHLGEVTATTEPAPHQALLLKSRGYATLSTASLETISGYVSLGDMQLIGTLGDIK